MATRQRSARRAKGPTSSESNPSTWMAQCPLPRRKPLSADAQADVCIVGAGIAGLSCAYLLARTGRKVIVLDDKPIAGGQSHRTSAHLSCIIDDRYSEIERIHGFEGLRLAAQSHAAAVTHIETLAREEAIACDFERVDAFLCAPDDGASVLASEAAAARKVGVAVEEIDALKLSERTTVRALRFPGQAQFHPLRYLHGLAEAVEKHGGTLCCDTRVTELSGGADAAVKTANGHTVKASEIVVATNSPINDRAVIHTKQAPYTTYVIAVPVQRGAIAPALYWDTCDPYHYVRVQRLPEDSANELLIVGGEDHKSGQCDDKPARFHGLRTWTQQTFGVDAAPRYQWSGQVMETLDGLGYIGRNPLDHDNVYIITGDSGMGLTHATLGAILITDLIGGIDNPWAPLYSPSRKPLATLRTFSEENLNVVLQMRDWVTSGDVETADHIPAGGGAILRQGAHKRAAFRDESGQLHVCSAVCPHLGCIVRWNEVERIWDCPCHGSRFDRYGKVITGPSRANLSPVDPRGS